MFLCDWRDSDSRTLRVVVTADDHVSFEERTGSDALGVDIWTPLDFDEKDINGFPLMSRYEWAELAVLAVLRGKRG